MKKTKRWIARDSKGDLCIHGKKPRRLTIGIWHSNKGYLFLPPEWFPEITWASDPIEVELTINIKNDDTSLTQS